jgi:hypothetical protein
LLHLLLHLLAQLLLLLPLPQPFPSLLALPHLDRLHHLLVQLQSK